MSDSNAPIPFTPLGVRVPCSTSNLGPGFDLLGLALSLWLEVQVAPLSSRASRAHTLTVSDDCARDWPRDNNLVLRAFDEVFAACGRTAPRCRFTVSSQIPMARGLGSSGAAVAAGLLLAKYILDQDSDDTTLISMDAIHEIGVEIEGHPDNVTASLFGGCTLCLPAVTTPGHQHPMGLVHTPLSSLLGYSVAWTDATLTTEEARACLPESIPFADAVENPRRLAMLLEGLRTAEPRLLALGAEDKLHHNFRLPLIPGGREALQAAKDAGAWMVAINGSGSSLLAIGPIEQAGQLAKAMANTLAEFAPNPVGLALKAVLGAPKIETDLARLSGRGASTAPS